MILFWVLIFILALASVVFIAWPIALDSGAAGETVPDEREQRQLAIDRDVEFGLIDEASADALKKQVGATKAGKAAEAGGPSRPVRFAALVCLGAAPLAAVLLYFNIGAPQSLGDNATVTVVEAAGAEASAAIAALEAETRNAPGNGAAWMALGEAYINAGRTSDGVEAFARAVSIDENNPDAHSAYGEALVFAANGAVTMDSQRAFNRALDLRRDEPRARFYMAEARYQVGAVEDAVRAWAALLNDSPPDAPWIGAVAARMSDAAAQAGIATGGLDLNERVEAMLSGTPAASDSGEEFDAALARIHDGSASYEDWMSVAAAHSQRGDVAAARDILDRAEARYENAPFVLAQIAAARTQLEAGEEIAAAPPPSSVRGPSAEQVDAISALPEDQQQQMIEGMVAGLADRLANEPDDPEGWRMLGRSYRVLGKPAESAGAWRELLARVDGTQDDWREFAYALLAQQDPQSGVFGEELEQTLQTLQGFDPDDPLVLLNLGEAARARGDTDEALRLWTRLQELLPPDAPFAPTLSAMIAELEG